MYIRVCFEVENLLDLELFGNRVTDLVSLTFIKDIVAM